MPGRPLLSEADFADRSNRGFGSPDAARRRFVLRETIDAIQRSEPPDRYHRLAAANLARWRSERETLEAPCQVLVFSGDWGEVTGALTKNYAACFAVLNMANAYVPGRAYVEGASAQEENIFRRSDCHFQIGPEEYDTARDCYVPEMTRLLSARDGEVYLDKDQPRVCIRGAENRSSADLGYHWLSDDQVFPFFELRAAAQDLRDGSGFDAEDARRRIAAQLDTLSAHRVRHAVLGAFGCGAFCNPAAEVARIYRGEISSREQCFDAIAFAIFSPGYGPDNYTPFAKEFAST